jgi:hypothetical protein
MEMILSLAPDSDGEGAGAAMQDGKGAIVGPLQGRYDAAAVHPDERDMEEVPSKLLWQLVARVVLASREKTGHQGFGKFFRNLIKGKLFCLQKLIG